MVRGGGSKLKKFNQDNIDIILKFMEVVESGVTNQLIILCTISRAFYFLIYGHINAGYCT